MKPCPHCKGAKVLHGFACPGFRPVELQCFRCLGNGQVPDSDLEAYEKGQQMRDDRLKRDMSLREEAARLHISPVELSHMEQGLEP